MNTVSLSDFRSQMAALFDQAAAGKRVFIRRRKKVYALVPISDENSGITPELQKKIDKARKEYSEGKLTCVSTPEEMKAFLNAL